MTGVLRRRLTMLHATLAHFDAHPDAWAGIEDVEDSVQAVRDGTSAIERHAETQAAATPEGVTENRDAARDAAEDLLARLGRRVSAHAIRIGDADLREAVDHSRSDWDRMAEADFFSTAADALDRTEAVLPDLTRVRVTSKDVDAARAAVEAARPGTAARDGVRARRVTATAALGGGYSAVVGPLDVLDRLVPELVEDAGFVAEYRVVRRVPGD